ncbi:MAG: hypothetical protein JO354_00720 [Verrucomicrobia bacterium]|nr:hypothetical protein [Verrucomicrobiota bacterium]
MRALRHWIAELVLVFVGVYAAFWLNNYQQHREELRRRDQIIGALEQDVRASIEAARAQVAQQTDAAARFKRALDAGEMPRLGAFSFTTDYSPSDVAALLESGGYQLLDVKTVVTLRKLESVARAGLNDINHFQKLSDELIVPNLDQDITFFYDPVTKQLRKRFAAYPHALDVVAKFFTDYATAAGELLTQLQPEEHRRY